MGRPVSFLRLAGCPIRCKFCDTPQAQDAGKWPRKSVEEIVNLIEAHRRNICVITGGEPCIHDLNQLTKWLFSRGIHPTLETSGAFPIRGHFRWITVSPKRLPLDPTARNAANEFKLVVQRGENIVRTIERHGLVPAPGDRRTIWLHPDWNQRNESSIYRDIDHALAMFPENCRIGCQMHKFYGAR